MLPYILTQIPQTKVRLRILLFTVTLVIPLDSLAFHVIDSFPQQNDTDVIASEYSARAPVYGILLPWVSFNEPIDTTSIQARSLELVGIEGSCSWNDSLGRLVFHPLHPLQHDQNYNLVLHDEILNQHGERLNQGLNFSFKTRAIKDYIIKVDHTEPVAAETTKHNNEINYHHYRGKFITIDGTEVPFNFYRPKYYVPPYSCVIYGHGYGGDKEVPGLLVYDLADRGHAVFAIDFRYHGGRKISGKDLFGKNLVENRDGFLLTLADLSRGIDWLMQTGLVNQEIAYVGTSLGALVGSVFCAIEPRVKVPILIVGGAPLGKIIEASNLDQVGKIRAALKEAKMSFDDAQLILDPVDPIHYISDIAPRNILFINGTLDDIVPVATNEILFAQALEPKRQIWYRDGHALIFHLPYVYQDLTQWCRDYLLLPPDELSLKRINAIRIEIDFNASRSKRCEDYVLFRKVGKDVQHRDDMKLVLGAIQDGSEMVDPWTSLDTNYAYAVCARDFEGLISAAGRATSIGQKGDQIAILDSIAPVLISPARSFGFKVPEDGIIKAFNIAGKLVFNGRYTEGLVWWEQQAAAQAVYFIRITAPDFSKSYKIVKISVD